MFLIDFKDITEGTYLLSLSLILTYYSMMSIFFLSKTINILLLYLFENLWGTNAAAVIASILIPEGKRAKTTY